MIKKRDFQFEIDVQMRLNKICEPLYFSFNLPNVLFMEAEIVICNGLTMNE